MAKPVFPIAFLGLLLCFCYTPLHSWSQTIEQGQIVNAPGDTLDGVRFNSTPEYSHHIHNPIELLQGRIPGLLISKPGSNPNGQFQVRLRGLSTLLNNDQPLYTVDGVSGIPLSLIDPQDIASIEIVRDGSTARWGLRGAAGVINIKTKKPTTGSPSIRFRSYFAMEQPGRSYDVLNATNYIYKERELLGSYEPASTQDNNWVDLITRKALSLANNLSIAGGTDIFRYRGALNWRNVEGIALNTGYDKLNARVYLQSSLLQDQLDLSLNLAGSNDKSNIGFREAFKYAVSFEPSAPKQTNSDQYGGYFQRPRFDYYNPLAILEQNQHEGNDKLVTSSLKATYKFNSTLKGLSARVLLSETREDLFRGEFYPAESFYKGYSENGFALTQSDERSNRFADFRLNWSGSIRENLELSTNIGHTIQNIWHEYRIKEARDIPNASNYEVINDIGISTLDGDEDVVEEDHLLSAFYGSMRVSTEALYIDFGLRHEGSSFLGRNSKWGTFPYLRTGIDIARLLNLSFADALLARGSYGVSGNLPVHNGWSKDQFRQRGYYYKVGEYFPSYTQTQVENPDLKWESTIMWNLGFDYTAPKKGFRSSVEYFHHNSADLIINARELPIPPYLASRGYFNMGEITNHGFEIALQLDAVQGSSLTYTTGLNFSTIKTTYNSLSNHLYSLDEERRGFPSAGGCGCSISFIQLKEDELAGQFYGPKYIGTDGEGGWKFVQSDGRPSIKNIGNGLPSSMLGWSHNLKYRNWNLNVLLRGVFGHDLVSVTRLLYENWNISTYNILESSPLDVGEFNQWSSYFVEDGDYLKLENLTVSYRFPIGGRTLKTARIFAAAENLFTITSYPGSDPSPRLADINPNFISGGSLPRPEERDLMVPGIDRASTWLNSRTLLIGIELTL